MDNKTMDSAVEYLRKMNAGEISALELVTEVIDRIETVNPALNAVVAMDKEQSLAQARQADAERVKTGPRPLLGLPITVKDSIDVKGFRCTGGSYARENHWPKEDASVVARLRSAGAIIIGKTNLPEYSSSYETDNALFGRTNNPADLARTPGGSTGGEAALLGADATLVGIGVDGGGSIRVPSHYCGTVGIRPTVGRTPDTGHWPVTRDTGYRDMMCLGPMARYVEDLALLLPIISGADGVDPYAVSVSLGDPSSVDLKGLRIGYYFDDGVAKVSQETEQGIKAAALALQESGAEVVEVEPPDSREATMLFFTMVGADGGASTWRDLEGSNGRHHHQFQTLLDGFGESLSVTDFFELQRRYFEMRASIRRSVAAYDAILCPVTTGPAPRHMEPPFGVPDEDYFKYEGFNYVHSYAVAGLPSTVVPIAEQEGMPLGVQVVASAYQEHVSLAVAAKLESMLGGFVPRMLSR
ncbi:MAG: Asp-tRNA(Asn)/Glu-tRNA(Gln) amidotransferase A subunit family amidase [Halioglobus sp.]|jgi:amidase